MKHDGTLVRSYLVESVRAVEGKERTFRFTIASELPVPLWNGGPGEVLRMTKSALGGGVQLARYRANPVVVDSHDISSIKSILGVASRIDVEGTELAADITTDPTPEGEAARARIESGSLRATSIRFRPNLAKVREVPDGAVEGRGDRSVKGPAVIVPEWELLEVTLCAVPKDASSLRRSFYQIGLGRRSGEMSKGSGIRYSDLPVGGQGGESDDDETEITETVPTPQVKKPVRGIVTPIDQVEVESRRAAARADARKSEDAAIRSLVSGTPSLKVVAEDCVLRGLSLDDARKEIQAEKAKMMKPGGTPEPLETPARGAQGQETTTAGEEQLTPDNVLRTLTGLRS